jgi:hypothetical protein
MTVPFTCVGWPGPLKTTAGACRNGAKKTEPVAPAGLNSIYQQYNTAGKAGKALIPAAATAAMRGSQNALPGAGLSC